MTRLACAVIFAGSALAQPALDIPLAQVVADGSSKPVLFATSRVRDSPPGLFRSANGGANWTAVYIAAAGQPQPSRLYARAGHWPPDKLYAGIQDGFYCSVDAGETWQHVTGTVRPSLGVPVALALRIERGTEGKAHFTLQAQCSGGRAAVSAG